MKASASSCRDLLFNYFHDSLSIYISAFNLIKNSFPYLENIDKACKFNNDGEVVVAVNKSEDETLDLIKSYSKIYNNLKVIDKLNGSIKKLDTSTSKANNVMIGLNICMVVLTVAIVVLTAVLLIKH